MKKTPLPHKDERLGHVAVDMGLMTREEVDRTQAKILGAAALGNPPGFAEMAAELGYLDRKMIRNLEAEELRRRRLIDGFEIIDILGAGTIATVYHAMQLSMQREVALKILHPRLASDPVFVQGYLAEAQAVSRFHHPHILQGFDAGQSNGFYYFAHEYLPGGSIADRLNRGGDAARFSETGLLTYLRQTASALTHAWAVAVYHGDINPGNLLLDEQGSIKLANLGVPRVATILPVKAGSSPAPGFVRAGPEYAAPEQLERPELVNARTDIYNLGATFYHISFGVPPFRPPAGGDMAEFRRRNPVPSFSLKSQEDFSSKYLRLIHDMLETDPDNRPADPEALQERLEKFHTPDSGDYARQVVRLLPSTGPRVSRRLERRVNAPASMSERSFSLRRRKVESGTGRVWFWLAAAGIAVAVALLLWLAIGSGGAV